MLYALMCKEIKSLEEITQKTDLMEYYHKCQRLIPEYFSSNYTQFEFEKYEGKINDLIIGVIRDYALFDEDNSYLLKEIDINKEDRDDVFNCFSPDRM